MYMHSMSAPALHMRTSIATHRQAHERPLAAAAAVVATPRSRVVEPQPSPAMVAKIERPVGVGERCR